MQKDKDMKHKSDLLLQPYHKEQKDVLRKRRIPLPEHLQLCCEVLLSNSITSHLTKAMEFYYGRRHADLVQTSYFFSDVPDLLLRVSEDSGIADQAKVLETPEQGKRHRYECKLGSVGGLKTSPHLETPVAGPSLETGAVDEGDAE